MKKSGLLGVVVRIPSLRLSINTIKQIMEELKNLFDIPVKDFIKVWQAEREKEGKIVSSDDLLTCYEICKDKCVPKIILRVREAYKVSKFLEINDLDELNNYLSYYTLEKIIGLSISMSLEDYSIYIELFNSPFSFSTISIHSRNAAWLNETKERLSQLFLQFKTYNYLFNNPVTLVLLTCIISISSLFIVADYIKKEYGFLIVLPYFIFSFLLFWGLFCFARKFLPLLKWSKK
jgi:hypothetical protein